MFVKLEFADLYKVYINLNIYIYYNWCKICKIRICQISLDLYNVFEIHIIEILIKKYKQFYILLLKFVFAKFIYICIVFAKL